MKTDLTGVGWLPCPGLWCGPGDADEHMCILLLGHDGDCLCGSCGQFRAGTEG